jgi:hypothetical protein
MDEIFLREGKRRERAKKILEKLDLLQRWSHYGRPILVGAFRYGLMVELDIDMVTFSNDPRIEHGFQVMSEVARLPGVWKVRFTNELDGPDQ